MIRFPVSQPSLGTAERAFVNQCLDANWLTMGSMTARFEQEFAARLGVKHAVMTTSGTTALHLVLVAMGVGPGDEVIVPSMTFVATANAVHYTGAKVVLADINLKNWGLDATSVAHQFSKRTKCILPVHLYGIPADMLHMHDFSVPVIEDAAEGLGGTWHGTPLGVLGRAGVFSLFGNKVITTGEGGLIVTSDGNLAARMRFLRGQALSPERRYYHPEIGFNYRPTDLQAAVGLGQLQTLDAKLARRREIIRTYTSELAYYAHCPIDVSKGHAPWMFTLQLPPQVDRDRIAIRLLEQGIETRPTFVPMHQLPMWRQPDWKFPNATALGASGISLPTYPALTFDEVHEISAAFIKAYNEVG